MDPMTELNADLLHFAEQHRLRTRRHSDGELVIPLRGSRDAHMGRWSRHQSYILIPTGRPAALTRVLLELMPCGEDHGSDAEVLVVAPHADLEAVVLQRGRRWSARHRRPAASADHLQACPAPRLQEPEPGSISTRAGDRDQGATPLVPREIRRRNSSCRAEDAA